MAEVKTLQAAATGDPKQVCLGNGSMDSVATASGGRDRLRRADGLSDHLEDSGFYPVWQEDVSEGPFWLGHGVQTGM